MKVPACQALARPEPSREHPAKRRFSPGILAAWALVLLLLLCGCSSFNRDWRQTAAQPTGRDSIEGRWEGSWISEVNGHHGKLRCLLTHQTEDRYQARFRATYARVLRFSYTVPLAFQSHEGGWEFNGEADLGKLGGGVYYYEGRVSTTNLHSTYRSKYDHGTFQLRRPE